jgi:ferredoxin
MQEGAITKQQLEKMLTSLSDGWTVYAPINQGDKTVFDVLHEDNSISYDYVNTQKSLKNVFFPQREVLCTFEDQELKEVPYDETKYVVFGARPCDTMALVYLDKIFSDVTSRFKDPYYLNRRENSVVISLACNEAAETCFCTSVEGSPTGREGADIIAFEVGERLLLEAVTEKGEQFLEENKKHFEEVTEDDRQKQQEQEEEVKKQLKEIDLEGIKQKLDTLFDDEDWERVTARCIGCGSCTFFCPTCHCFNITDETDNSGKGVRLRSWDSCQYPLFTRHASGHNPRPQKTQRMRQRIMHKFSYTVEKTNDIYCVGCGRCIVNCPVDLDIREILTTFEEKQPSES